MTLRMAYARSLAVVLEDVSAAQIVRARPRAAREANLARERRVRGGDEEPQRAVLRIGDAPANRGVRVRRARGRAPSRRLARRRGRRRGEVQNDEATAEPRAVERLALLMCASMEGLTVFAGYRKPWAGEHAILKRELIGSFMRMILPDEPDA